jgi:zinc D-Ala-D-Ala dipeptidase
MKKICISIVLIICITLHSIAQPTNIITSKKQYLLQVDSNAQKKLVDIQQLIPSIMLDLRYNTANNFTKTTLYKKANTTYLLIAPASALVNIQNALLQKGLGIKIFDAYRPYATTKLMWDLIHDDRYVANPKNGSNHNRGLAIDLTIVNLKTLQELDMGTGFDNFTDTAHHSFSNLSQSILNNRKLLKSIMEQNGFKSFDTEWWHYSWPNNLHYEVIDLSFKSLKKLIK